MERQALLAREDPPRLWAIMDEASARRQVGGPQVMAAQLARLGEAAALPNVTLQVIPFAAGAHPGLPGSFIVLDFADPADQNIVYIDSLAGDLFLEQETEISRYIVMFEHLARRPCGPMTASPCCPPARNDL